MTDLIATHPVFAQLSVAQRALLADGGTPVSYRAGERLFAEGGPADRFWLVGSGSVALDMQVPGRGEQVIETLVGGTVLGWSWLYRPYRWHFGAVAREQTATVAFDAVAVRQRCLDDPAFGYAIMCCFTPVIIERLMATRLRVLDLYATPAEAGRRSAEAPS
jgi:CRP/FNR family cyclic AMP-dependent transcriptional regulator